MLSSQGPVPLRASAIPGAASESNARLRPLLTGAYTNDTSTANQYELLVLQFEHPITYTERRREETEGQRERCDRGEGPVGEKEVDISPDARGPWHLPCCLTQKRCREEGKMKKRYREEQSQTTRRCPD